jgi:hypothetical protein
MVLCVMVKDISIRNFGTVFCFFGQVVLSDFIEKYGKCIFEMLSVETVRKEMVLMVLVYMS